jgi:magnesium-transporting ATPase (P-type)
VTGTFKANNPYNTFLLLIYGILLKLPMFLHPKIPQEQLVDGFLYKALLKWMHPIAGSISVIYPIIAYLLLYTQAVSFNKLVNELKLMQKPNYLTGMSYLLVTSLFTEWNMLSAPLIINTLLIWVWARMSGLYNDENPKRSLFNIGIAIGIATFFYFPSLAFVALIIFGLALIRPFKLSEWVIALLGIITPYYFLLAWAFLTDKWKEYKFPGIAVTSPKFNQTNWSYVAIIVVLITCVAGFFFVQQNFRRQLIQARKSWNLVFLYLVVAVFIPFINATHTFEYWILCAVPLSALLGAAFLYPAKKTVPYILHWIMVAFVIAINYFVH